MSSAEAFIDRGPRILEEVRSRAREWTGLAEDLAKLESPSSNREAQGPVLQIFAASLEQVGLHVRRVRASTGGGLLLGVPRRVRGQPVQLILGHCDTVWPLGTTRRMPVQRDGPLLRGPGVFDMKAGLASIVVALRVLSSLGLSPSVAPIVLVNSDEETGSRESTRHIRRLARRASRAFVLEPALGLEGRLKTARMGVGRFTVRISGRASHAGLDPEKGASAVRELARVVDRLYALAVPGRGIALNVGRVGGGTAANVVAGEARAEVDVRFESLEGGRWVEERIRALEPEVAGCRITVEGGADRPPLERTPANRVLTRAAIDVARRLGLDLKEGLAGGGSDGCTTSLTTPTLDGLGAVGDGAHAEHEHVHVERSLERCALFAVLLLLPPLPPQPDLANPEALSS